MSLALPVERGVGLSGQTRRTPLYLLRRAIGILRGRFALRRARLGDRVAVMGRLDADIEGTCEVGERTTFRGGTIPTVLRVGEAAHLSIGNNSVLSFGVFLDVSDRVEIGARCMFGSMVAICDREGERVSPITIGEGVWVAHGAQIRPGVSVGDGAVIAAGSVVSSDVPPRFLAVGNPAKCAPLTMVAQGKPSRSPEPSAEKAIAGGGPT